MEERYIRMIKAGIFALNQGTKTPSQTKAPMALNKLKTVNLPMYEDLLQKWKKAVEDYKAKNA
jgi:hypothetical protein